MTISLLFCGVAHWLQAAPLVTAGKTPKPPVIDGKLNDRCWTSAIEINNFIKYKSGGMPATQDTKVYIMYDDNNLYLAFRCMEKYLDPVLNQLHRFKTKAKKADQDTFNVFKDDSVEIFLAPDVSSPSRYYHICVSASGIIYDSLGMAAPQKWKSNAKVKTRIGAKFWTVEVSVPLKDITGNKIISSSTEWKGNFCRNAKPDLETSSWSRATARGFHDPATFGNIRFADFKCGVSEVTFPVKCENGINHFNSKVKNFSDRKISAELRVSACFDNSDKVIFSDKAIVAASQSKELSVVYPISGDNKCINWKFADKGDPTEAILRSKNLNFKPNTNYHFKALVKTDYSWNQNKPYNFFIIRQPGGGYKGISDVKVIRKSNGWVTISGVWRNGKVTSGELWVLKWAKRKIKGTLAIDNVSLIEDETGRELIHNGDFSKGPAGWSILRKHSVKSGYGNGAEKTVLKYSIAVDGKEVYRSSDYKFILSKENAAVSSRFVNFGHDGVFLLEDIALAIGAPERLNLVIKSSKNKLSDNVYCQIVVPEFCRMLNPQGRKNSITPSSIKEEIINRNGKRYRSYLLAFSKSVVSSGSLGAWAYVAIPVVLEATGPLKAGVDGNVEYRAWFNDKEREAQSHKLKLKVLPPLTGKQPGTLPLILWAYPELYQFYSLSEYEQDRLIRKIAQAGYNGASVRADSIKHYAQYGIKGFGLLPTITRAGNYYFPGVDEFLKKHPEYSGIYPDGKKALAIDPAYLLDDKCKFHSTIKKVMADHVKCFPDFINWDYEFGFMPRGKHINRAGAFGFSKRNLEMFKSYCGIPVGVKLDSQTIYSKYRKQWLKFRCLQNAQIAGLYRRFVKEANKKCIFSFYSGYPPYAAETYGTDWAAVTNYVDLPMCGYGGDDALMMKEIKQKYYNAGVLLMSYVDQAPLQNTFGKYLALAGSYMGYIHFVVDGRYFYASSKIAAIAADFERFFLNLKGNQHNELTVGLDGKTRNDVKTITYGKERLIMVFNNSGNPKKLSFSCKNVSKKFIGIDYDSKKVYKNLNKVSIELLPWQVKAVYVCSVEELESKPQKTQIVPAYTSEYPVLRWKDDESRINHYELQYSNSPNFSDKTVKVNVADNIYQIQDKLTVGKWFWRVRAVRSLGGLKGEWSNVAEFKVVTLRLLSFVTPKQPALNYLESWSKVSWGGGGSISELKKDYKEKHSGLYSLKIQNPYETTNSYWTTYRNAGGCSKLPVVKKGQKYKLTGYLKTKDGIKANLTIGFIDGDGKLMRTYRKSFVISGDKDWTEVTVEAVVPAKAVSLRVLFGGNGKGTAWCSGFKLQRTK
jgi:hypothetical protein